MNGVVQHSSMLVVLTASPGLSRSLRTVQVDRDRFDDWQRALGRTLTEEICEALTSVTMSAAQRRELTADLAFRVPAMLDGAGGVWLIYSRAAAWLGSKPERT
jgi:hypothetical protein